MIGDRSCNNCRKEGRPWNCRDVYSERESVFATFEVLGTNGFNNHPRARRDVHKDQITLLSAILTQR
ncbi:hypothetical protein J6590_000519 [Homalodisca vitripennis]|nr:hypothetical protein J6590_000519 [Homalodisca vitripennis]